MTENKLPEVGKRYRFKGSNSECRKREDFDQVIVGKVESRVESRIFIEGWTTNIGVKAFWEFFEELPDTKAKEECNCDIPINTNGTCSKCGKYGYRGDIYSIGSEFSDEVKKAMEELKFTLRNIHLYHTGMDSKYLWARLDAVTEKAQTLLKALDNQTIQEKDVSCKSEPTSLLDRACNLECEIIKLESELNTKRAHLRCLQRKLGINGDEEKYLDQRLNLDEGLNESKSEEKPLWRDLNRLDLEQVIFKKKDGNYALINDLNRVYNIIAKTEGDLGLMESFCTVSDFIKYVENINQCLKKLEAAQVKNYMEKVR